MLNLDQKYPNFSEKLNYETFSNKKENLFGDPPHQKKSCRQLLSPYITDSGQQEGVYSV